jgi:RNA polymerase sigma-70 factor, ECF subfamily
MVTIRPVGGDKRFEEFFRMHYERVRRYVARRTRPALVDDVTSAAFTVAWRKFDAVEEPSIAWVIRIASFELSNARRNEQRRHDRESTWFERPAAQASTTEHVALAHALDELSDTDREIVRLVHWDELSRMEIAEVLGLAVGTVNVRYHRALRRLEAHLNAHDANETSTTQEVPR